MATPSEIVRDIRQSEYQRGIVATQSRRKLEGLNQTINPDVPLDKLPEVPEAVFPLDSTNPEDWEPESASEQPDEVARLKIETLLKYYLSGDRPQEKNLVFAVDVVTLIAREESQLIADQGYNLARLSRHFDDPTLSPEAKAVKQESLAEVERSTMAALCVNNNFWIEWRVGFAIGNTDGQIFTQKVVMRSQFDGMDFMEVQQAFEPKEGKVPAFEVGPRLEFARLSSLNSVIFKVLAGEDGEPTRESMTAEEVMKYVYHCGFPPQVILDALEAFKAQPESMVH